MSYFVTAALLLGGMAVQNANTKRTARKQDNQLAKQLRTQRQHQQEADQQVRQLIDKRAQSDDTREKTQSLGQYMQALHAAQGASTRPLNQVGRVSDDYTQQANDAALGVSQYGANQADMLASIDAPMLQRQRESTNNLRFGTSLDAIRRRAEGDDFLNQLRLGGIRRDPWLDFAANAAMGYAGARASGDGADSLWAMGGKKPRDPKNPYNFPYLDQ